MRSRYKKFILVQPSPGSSKSLDEPKVRKKKEKKREPIIMHPLMKAILLLRTQ